MLSIIVAKSLNHVIGNKNQLPWHLSEDLKRFKNITMGHPIIMGRKTFESIGRPLPGRKNIVVTRQTDYQPEGVTVIYNLDQFKELAHSEEELFVIGGSEIYKALLPFTQKIYLTKVLKDIEGDAFFPDIETNEKFKTVEVSEIAISEKENLKYQYVTLERVLES